MSFISNNLAALTVSLVAAIIAWLYGGTRGDLLAVVAPWMMFFLLEVLVFFPQRRGHETTYDARRRLWKTLKRDPLVWTAVALVLLLAVPFFNDGLCRYCDAKLIAAGQSPAPGMAKMPFCVSRLDHLNVFWWFSLAMLSAVVVRNSLSRHGQRLVIASMVWNGALLALFGFLESATGALGPYWMTHLNTYCSYGKPTIFFSTFGYPNMGGSYFVLMFGLSVAMWRDSLTRYKVVVCSRDAVASSRSRSRAFWKRNIYLVPAVLCFYAALSTLSRAAIIMAVLSAAIYAYHAFATFFVTRKSVARVRLSALWLLGFVAVILAAVCYLPANIQKEVDNINAVKVLDRVSGRNDNQSTVAWKLFVKHKLFGCGGWGYRHFCRDFMDDRSAFIMRNSPGTMNVHNDYLQFLAEHGVVGLGLMVAMVVLLLLPVCRMWRKLSRASLFLLDAASLPKPRQIFVLPAPAFMVLVACVCPLVHAFGDCPLRSLSVLLTFYVALAALPGFLPHEQSR